MNHRIPSNWQQQIMQRCDPEQWHLLAQKLEAALDPSIRHPELIDRYYLPLFFHLYQQARDHGKSGFIAGINAPQGGGKSTLTSYLVQLFDWVGLRAVTLSIDDFYLTRSAQVHLAGQHADNPYLQQRGYPGTHDIALGADILTRLQQGQAGQTLALPRYDKSRHNGQGDRSETPDWPVIELPVDVVLLEGWMLGFQPSALDQISDPHLAHINKLLLDYQRWHHLLDSFVYLAPEDPAYVVDWRSEAEERMKAKGLPGMSAAEIRAYAEKFLPAYRIYGPPLIHSLPLAQTGLLVRIGKNRLPV